MSLYVGTSGWAYDEWRPGFYPEGLPRARFLEHYARSLPACEINATFYRLQSEKTLTGWAAATPDAFRFAVKAHRRISHARRLAAGEDWPGLLEAFVGSLEALGDRLGCVLFQLPPHRRRDDEALERLLSALPEGLPCAFEFRHRSWEEPGVGERIAAAGGAVCLSETEGGVPDRLPRGAIAYVRLRAERYAPEARDAWWELLVREARDRDVYAFAKHEGVPVGNPFAGVGLAEWLAR